MSENKKTTYITTPIYYSSGNVHIGNSYTTIACDALARFKRLKGNDTFYLTGMDEHGQKIQETAAKRGITPQELTDMIALETQKLWQELQISNDYFIRTTDEVHSKTVQDFFEIMLAKGDIYLGSYEGDYCVSCETFYSKTQVGENNTCPDCSKPLTKVQEECYFLKLSKYSDRLLKHIQDHPDFIQPESRRNEVISFIQSGLEDLSVSRTTFTWGIPVKSNPKHVVYVWIDALVNYISALNYQNRADGKYEKFWEQGDEVIHVLGKDILRFHAIIWPIILMSLDIPVNCKVYVHGWILMKDGKMSKSSGNMVYPREIISRYGLDALRYYLLREMPFGNDALFSYDRFLERYNSDLANDLGNLLKRTITMINKYFDGVINKPKILKNKCSIDVQKSMDSEISKACEHFDGFRFQNGLICLWNIISRANKYIDETSPWVLANDMTKKDELEEVMYVLYETLRNVCILIGPIMPDAMIKMKHDLCASDDLTYKTLGFGKTETIQVAKSVEVLFARYDISAELTKIKLEQEEKNQKPESQKKKSTCKEEITIEDFEKVDLRVGLVLEAKKMAGSDKLLVLQVKIEDEVRQIVSGIAGQYSESEMVGKYVVVVANLKPVKLRGEISNGMILAASNTKESLEVIEVKKEKEYARVK